MAYSFTDIYRPLRAILRLNGLLIGCGLGAILLLASPGVLLRWGLLTSAPDWTTRLAGALLIVWGVYCLLAAAEAIIDRPALITSMLAHSLIAIVLLSAYLQRELISLGFIGQVILVIVFALCMAGALLPLRYLRADYRTF